MAWEIRCNCYRLLASLWTQDMMGLKFHLHFMCNVYNIGFKYHQREIILSLMNVEIRLLMSSMWVRCKFMLKQGSEMSNFYWVPRLALASFLPVTAFLSRSLKQTWKSFYTTILLMRGSWHALCFPPRLWRRWWNFVTSVKHLSLVWSTYISSLLLQTYF